MSRVDLHNIGSLGIILDTPDHLLPPEAWSGGSNVRFDDNKVLKFSGHRSIYAPINIPPYWLMSIAGNTQHLWLYAGLTAIHAYAPDAHVDITRASGPYTATQTSIWTGGILGGIGIVNNGVDVPQAWVNPDTQNLLVDLANWPANTTCKAIRPFLNYLVAFDVTLSGTRSPHKVKWSHSADPGTVPNSWDHTDETKDAGESELTDTDAGFVLDSLPLRGVNILYKAGSVHTMSHIGGRFIFKFDGLFEGVGMLAARCVCLVGAKGADHFVATADDIIRHDGQEATSLLDRRWKKFLASDLDADNFAQSYCVSNGRNSEAWFCYPSVGNIFPNKAIVWNWDHDTIALRTLPSAAFIATGILQDLTSGDAWDDDTGQWDADATPWGDLTLGKFARQLLIADPGATKFYQANNTDQFDAVSFTSYIERTGLGVAGQDRQGNPKVDKSMIKTVTRMWLNLTGGPVNVKIGSSDTEGGAVTWTATKTYTVGTDTVLDFDDFPPGRFIAVNIGSTGI